MHADGDWECDHSTMVIRWDCRPTWRSDSDLLLHCSLVQVGDRYEWRGVHMHAGGISGRCSCLLGTGCIFVAACYGGNRAGVQGQ
jgi:hypothetical protein